MGKRLLMKTFVIMTPRSGVIMTGLLPQALLGGQILGLSVYLHWLQRTMRSTVVIKRRAFAFVRGVGTPGTRKQEASHMRVELHCMLADHLLCMFYWHDAMCFDIFARQIVCSNPSRKEPTTIFTYMGGSHTLFEDILRRPLKPAMNETGTKSLS